MQEDFERESLSLKEAELAAQRSQLVDGRGHVAFGLVALADTGCRPR